MDKLNSQKSGVALLIALGTVLMVAILGLVVLRHVSSSSSLTQHQVGRTQAYYAAKAGVNYVYDELRRGDLTEPLANNFGLVEICDSSRSDCPSSGMLANHNESNLPISVERIIIALAGRGAMATYGTDNISGCAPCNPPTGVETCICAMTIYFNPS